MTENGFMKANSGNLPCIDMFMVATYLSSSDNLVGAELKGVKNARAGRESYGDNAIGYVQLQRSQTTCEVKARITPEHRVRNKCYNVMLTVDESTGTILSAGCQDCPAALGGCKHAIALLMWCHRRSEDPAPTSVACYWKKSKLSKVGSEIKFIKAKSLVKEVTGNRPKHSPKVNVPGSFLSDVISEGIRTGSESQITNHYKPVEASDLMCVNALCFSFIKKGGGDAADFFEFCGRQMETEFCLWAEKKTRAQSEVALWHELRFGRITASKIYEAARSKTFSGSLVESILGAKIADTVHMKRGRDLEPQVVKIVEEKLEMKFNQVGIILRHDIPVVGASPDAINNDYVVEIKCPSSDKCMKNYVNQGKLANKFYAQIQLQMHMANKGKGLFCVAHPSFEISKEVDIFHVSYDRDCIETIINDAMVFWECAIFPKLMEKRQ